MRCSPSSWASLRTRLRAPSRCSSGAGESALVISVSVVVVLLIVLIAALLVARSLAVPLRRLRAAALDIATSQLPERMRRLSEAPDVGADIPRWRQSTC